MDATKLEHLLNPQVLSDMVSYELEKQLKLTGYYRTDTTLKGRPGDTITVPSWNYLGMAEDVPENEEVPVRQMSFTDLSYTIKKAALDVIATDESLLSGYGSPMNELSKQLRISIQEKIEEDGWTELRKITPVIGQVYVPSGAARSAINYDTVVEALDLFEDEEQGTAVSLLVNHTQVKNVRKDARFADRLTIGGDRVFFNGMIGSIAGAQVVISNRLQDDEAYLLLPQSLTAFMKRDVNIETQREMPRRRTRVGVDCHYVVAIEDFTKIVKINFTI